ncbi:hypothetical protein LS72_000965 [Helicobacter apodemus]|uniref:Uncharacterized protein n=1 Tax=Helicobacter apodemus TaxID=135569 RepID=A0A4U8UGL1_9HELI|nr:hypothetical protein [Helicobacter apodemus]TLE16988.1 hypothetical protein LS72_000965 [Helicobacter apodemus]
MIKLKETHQLTGSILTIEQTGNSTFCVDNTFFITQINEDLKVEKTLCFAKDAQSFHRYSHACGISRDFYFCIPINENHKSFILEYENEKIKHIATLDDHDGDIETCKFSDNGEFFATGGQDGRVFIYDGKSFLPIASLMPRSDYISVISFSHNNEFMAISGYDKFTLIFDFLRHKVAFNLQMPDVVEASCFFEKSEKLLLICRNGDSIIFSLKEGKILSSKTPFAFWPTSIAIDEEENYALIGTRSDTLYVLSLKNNSKVIEIKNERPGIASLKFSNGFLYIGCVDGGLLIVDYNEGKEELKESIDRKAYKGAREIIDKNIFLSIHPLMTAFDEAWPEILDEAINLLNQDKVDQAVELVEPFVVDESKKSDFDFYLAQKDGVKDFLEHIDNKNYKKAYEMLKTAKFLVKTKAYEKLENIWNKAFFEAKKLLIENAQLNERLAKQHLQPFESTPKKELIAQLLHNADAFVKADNYIKSRNFKEYFSLTFKFSFLRETDLYKKVLLLGEKMFDNAVDLEKKLQYDEAKKIAETLLVFPNLKRFAQEKIVLIQQKESFLLAIENREIKKVYSMVNDNEQLRSMKQFKEFTKIFLTVYEAARVYAYEGNAKQVMITLGEYMEIPYWTDKIASLMKIAYLQQISDATYEADVNWDITIRRYYDRFGKSIELIKLLEGKPMEGFLDKFEEEGNSDGYRYHHFVEDIVIYIIQKEQDY